MFCDCVRATGQSRLRGCSSETVYLVFLTGPLTGLEPTEYRVVCWPVNSRYLPVSHSPSQDDKHRLLLPALLCEDQTQVVKAVAKHLTVRAVFPAVWILKLGVEAYHSSG